MTLKNLLKFLYLTSSPIRSIRLIRIIRLIPAISFPLLLFAISVYFYLLKGLPSPHSLATIPVPLTTHIRDRNGVELYKIYKDQNRTPVKLDDIPLHFRQAILAIEDADFYSHSGFSLTGIIRAAFYNLQTKSYPLSAIQRGSTITQQLVKTPQKKGVGRSGQSWIYFLGPSRSRRRGRAPALPPPNRYQSPPFCHVRPRDISLQIRPPNCGAGRPGCHHFPRPYSPGIRPKDRRRRNRQNRLLACRKWRFSDHQSQNRRDFSHGRLA